MAVLKNKMHLRLLIIAILTVLLLGAKGGTHFVITLINKAGMEVSVSFVASDLSEAYYITIPEGSRSHPYVQKISLPRAAYRMRVFWMEQYDPETGAKCAFSRTSRVLGGRNMRIVIGDCDAALPTRGEPTMYKFGRWRCME